MVPHLVENRFPQFRLPGVRRRVVQHSGERSVVEHHPAAEIVLDILAQNGVPAIPQGLGTHQEPPGKVLAELRRDFVHQTMG